MNDSEEVQTRNLEQRLSEAEATIEALRSGQIDAVVDSKNKTPGLLAKAQEALLESEERFRQMAEAIPEVFFLIDPPMKQVFYVSPAYEDIYGRSCESLYTNPRSWSEAVHPDDRERVLETIAPQGTLVSFDVEYQIVRPNGSERSIRAKGFPIHSDTGEIYRYAGIAEDITERRVLEAKLRQAHKMDAVGQLASGIAHDFNNLLTVILGFGELMLADASIAEQHRIDLGEIIKAAQRAAGLTQQLLAFSRKQVLRVEPIDVNGLITAMTGMLGRLIGGHIEIRLDLALDLSPALTDRGQLEQVVMNLVVNARDAMPNGGRLTIETKDVDLENSFSHPETVMHGQYVMLAVSDTGAGMTKEVQRRVFEPFFTTKKPGKGTGLGLSTTYGIVKQSKGYIWVDSEPGRGTTFQVYLPRSRDGALLQTLNPPVTAAALKRDSETVLLVEDEAGVRQLAREILERTGYRVLEASNADDAHKLFAQHSDRIDLVVTDVMMPGSSGFELIGRLRARAPALRVLYMSGYTEPHAAQKSSECDSPFLRKPFTVTEFVRHVREALHR